MNSKEISNISNQICSRLLKIKSCDYRDIKTHDMNYNGIKKRSRKCTNY